MGVPPMTAAPAAPPRLPFHQAPIRPLPFSAFSLSALQPFPSLMEDPSVLDPQSIENLRALNPGDNDAFLREIAGIFLEDTPQRLVELDTSLAAGDAVTFTRAAHSIKGSSSNMGALVLKSAAEKLENRARTQGLTDLAPLVADVKLEFQRAQAALAELLGT